jgi:hypothetical protein
MLTKFRKTHNLEMRDRAKKQRRRMQNLVEHVKLLHTCVSLGKSLQRKEI